MADAICAGDINLRQFFNDLHNVVTAVENRNVENNDEIELLNSRIRFCLQNLYYLNDRATNSQPIIYQLIETLQVLAQKLQGEIND